MAIERDRSGTITKVTYEFKTASNVIDQANPDIDQGILAEVYNMDIDNFQSLVTRKGTTKLSTTVAHSAYEYDGIVYLVSGGSLCRYTPPTTVTPLIAVNATLPMVYEPVNNLIVATNGQQILIIESGAVSQLSSPTEAFKVKTPAGNYLAYYDGRLYVASGNTIHCTDPFSVEQCDERQMYIPVTPDTITGIVAVDNGLYVGTTRETFFISGTDPFSDSGFSLIRVADYGVIHGTMKKVQANKVKISEAQGNLAVWASPRGFCCGGNSGAFKNMSIGVYELPDASRGNLMLREENGVIHLVAVLSDGAFYNIYQEQSLEIDEAELT